MPVFPEDIDPELAFQVLDLATNLAEQAGTNTAYDPDLDTTTPEDVSRAYHLAFKRGKRYTDGTGGGVFDEDDPENIDYVEGGYTSVWQANEYAWAAGSVYDPTVGCFVGPRTQKPRVERAYWLGFLRGAR